MAALAQVIAERVSRAETMARYYREGETLQQIGDRYGITRERVRQLLKSIGLGRRDGGVCRRGRDAEIARRQARHEARERRYMRVYGCAYSDVLRLNEGIPPSRRGSPAQLYARQRQNAKNRGIEWSITLPEWLGVWIASGHMHERGLGRDKYVMGRFGDAGPYSFNNVYITTCAGNGADYQRGRLARLGRNVRGWSYNPRLRKNPYVVKLSHKHIGYFPTQEAAEAAYASAKAALKSHGS